MVEEVQRIGNSEVRIHDDDIVVTDSEIQKILDRISEIGDVAKNVNAV